jgi:hypothetical protein
MGRRDEEGPTERRDEMRHPPKVPPPRSPDQHRSAADPKPALDNRPTWLKYQHS